MVILALSLCAANAVPGGVVAPFENLPRIELRFDLGGQQPEWVQVSCGTNEARYTCDGHTLTLKLEGDSAQRLLRLRLDAPQGKTISVKSYEVRVTLPVEGLHAVTVPDTIPIAETLFYYGKHHTYPDNICVYRCLIPESFQETGHTNKEEPLILLTDDKGANAAAIGWAAARRNSMLKGEAQGDNYVLTLTRREDVPFTGECLEDALVVSTAKEPWFDVATAYARAFDKYNGVRRDPAPDWATDPVFCTWYCYSDHIDQDGLLKIARKCKELGFGTILVDAGWDSKTDGGYADFKTGVLGDYTAMPDRFPDFAGTIKQIHDMGLRVELWSGPFWEGKKSRAYQEKTKSYHMRDDAGEMHELCPRHPEVRKHLKESFARIARTYGIDGMWIDAADSIPGECKSDHEHLDQPMGEAFVNCMLAIREGLRSVNPKAVVEARVMHANIHTKCALDVVQPADAPNSYEMLRFASIHLRHWVYDGVVKNDPMIWPKKADPSTVAKFLATMVCNGVPALSVDYLTAPEEHCKLTSAWLDFYKQHKQTLLNGSFRLFGEDYGRPDMMLVGDKEAVVYLTNSKTGDVELPKPVDRIILLNCTDSDSVNVRIAPAEGAYEVAAHSPDWSQLGDPTTAAAQSGALTISQPCPQGGAIVIPRR